MADGASYQIAIDAKTVGADASAAQLTALAEQIRSAAAVATSFDGAIAAATSALTQAKSEAASAADALGAGEAKYNSLEAAANKAARAVEAAAAKGKDTSALQASADSAAAAMIAQGAAVDELRTKAQEAAAAQQELASTLATLQAAARSEASATKAAAMKAEAAAAKEAAAALKEKAAAEKEDASAAEAAASADTSAAAATKEKGQSIEEMTYLAKGAMGPMGGVFERGTMLVKGFKGMSGGAMALAGALGIIAVGAALVAASFAMMGKVVEIATFAVTSNEKAMKRINAAAEKWKKNLAKLFTGINLDPFLKGMESVLGVFNEGTSSAKAVKSLLSTIFQPLFNAAAAVLPAVKVFLKGLVSGALEVAIVAVTLRNKIMAMIPPSIVAAISKVTAGMSGMDAAFAAGKYVIVGVLAVVGILAVVFTAAAAVIGVLVATFGVFVGIIYAAAAATVAITQKLVGFVAGLIQSGAALLNWAAGGSDAASSMVQGIIGGLSSGAGAVAEAMRSLASGAINAFKSAIGYGSPAKAYIEIAKVGIGGGLAEGADQSQSVVDKAIGDLATPPSDMNVTAGVVGSSASNTGGRSTSTSGSTITIGSVVINAKTDDPEGFAEAFIRFCESQLVTVGGT